MQSEKNMTMNPENNKKANKKASSILMMIFEIIVVSVVIYLTISIAHAYGSSLLTAKINAAEDIKMMVNTLVAVPGDALVEYPKNVTEFSFILIPNSISVFENAQTDQSPAVRAFFLPQGYTAEGSVIQISPICLEKKSKRIILKPCLPEE